MKLGIFIFGDNQPELRRSNQKYYQEVLTMADLRRTMELMSTKVFPKLHDSPFSFRFPLPLGEG